MKKFENIDELKEFLTWSKEQGLVQVQIDDMTFTFCQTIIAAEYTKNEINNNPAYNDIGSTPSNPEEDPDLYHSTY